uniref:Uncharacterized protein n=1 Tax=Leishmania guyanensis TaxID=5670 RepID=A0A1E1IZA4_LEIGU|nr:Hypothetical protein BN36_2332440 [Leishmania guyanensis]
METRTAAQSKSDARVIQNLSLRRRCMFLMDHEMWRVCILSTSSDVAATSASASAAQLRSSTVALLRTHSSQLEKFTESGVEDVQAAVTGMTAALLSASSPASSDAKVFSAPTSTAAAASLSSATCNRNNENLCWAQWVEALETLLAFLDEPHGASTAHSPTSSWNKLTIDGSAGGGSAGASCETDLERAVRTLLCGLVIHLYETGRAYYAAKKGAKRAAASNSKRSRDTPDDDGNTGHCKMRVTWSVAAPIDPLLYNLYKR